MPRAVKPRRHILLLLLAAAIIPAAAAVNDVFALFSEFIAKTAVTMNFQQRTYDSANTLLNETGGRLIYQRPDKFRLQYDAPGNPLIISDGENVWVYEEELQQVVVQPFASASKNGLLEVLISGDIATLQKNYVLSANISGDLRWLNADAADPDAAIRLIALGFRADNSNLTQVVISDHFAGRVEMNVENINHTIQDAAAVFSFTPPAGTDIIRPN